MSKTYDQIPAQPTVMLANRPYMPYGDVVLLYGEASLGKGRMVMSFISDVTNGKPLAYDEEGQPPGDVWVLLPEDKPGEQVKHRLEAAGADVRRVHDLTKLDSDVRFKFSATKKVKAQGDLPVLWREVVEAQKQCLCGFEGSNREELDQHLMKTGVSYTHASRNPRLVVADPITALIGEGTINTNPGARAFMEPIQDFADATGVCVILVAHPTKAGVLQGSGALRDAARVVYYAHWDKNDSTHRVLSLEKGNNVGPTEQADLKFTIVSDEQGRAKVEWLDRTDVEEKRNAWRDERLEAAAAYRAGQKAAEVVKSIRRDPKPRSGGIPALRREKPGVSSTGRVEPRKPESAPTMPPKSPMAARGTETRPSGYTVLDHRRAAR